MTNDTFTIWDGVPFPGDATVTVILRSGATITAKASELDWHQKEASGDIVAYKILEKITPEEFGAVADPKGHPNAATLMDIAKEAAVNAEYWKEFEGNLIDDLWLEINYEAHLYNLMSNMVKVRRKPRTIRIGSYDVPAPIRFAPIDCEYYMVNLLRGRLDKFISSESTADEINFNSGLCQETEADAELMLKALQELLGAKK